MISQKSKSNLKGFFGLIIAMLLYSTSGVMVTWLGIAFPRGGQLIIRAVVAILFCLIWIAVTKSGFRLHRKYHKKYMLMDVFTRPIYNFCFIMAVFGFKEATFALLLLFTAKVLTGGFIAVFVNKIKLGWFDLTCYLLAVGGILLYNWGESFEIVFLWAVVSGILEGIKSQAMAKLKIDDVDKPVVALYEFLMVALLGLVVVFAFDRGVFYLKDGLQLGFVTETFLGLGKTIWGIILALTAVVALAAEFYSFPKFSQDFGNIILATELGVAGYINFKLLSTLEDPILFGAQQQIALALFIVVGALVAIAESRRNKVVE